MNENGFKLILIFGVMVIAASATGQSSVKVVQPKQQFDARRATAMLAEGKSQIVGVAYYEGRTLLGIRSEETVYAREGTIVSLYPLTPYLEEYLKLKGKNKEGKQIASINAEAASYRVEVKIVNERGEFTFSRLRPGKYYLLSEVYFPSGISSQEVSGIVEITTDDEIVKCKLNKIFSGFIY